MFLSSVSLSSELLYLNGLWDAPGLEPVGQKDRWPGLVGGVWSEGSPGTDWDLTCGVCCKA